MHVRAWHNASDTGGVYVCTGRALYPSAVGRYGASAPHHDNYNMAALASIAATACKTGRRTRCLSLVHLLNFLHEHLPVQPLRARLERRRLDHGWHSIPFVE